MRLSERIKNSWNVFKDPDSYNKSSSDRDTWYGGSTSRIDRTPLRTNTVRSIVVSIYNQLAVDVSSVDIRHVRVNEDGNYEETLKDNLDRIFTTEANIDQTGRALVRDIVMTMFDEGVAALVPIDTDKNPSDTESFDIYSVRVGKIVEWYPRHVRVEVYNDRTGMRERALVEKRYTPIYENPFYSIMNQPNSHLQRLITVLNQLDRTNRQNSAGKIDLLIQLPYAVRGKAREIQANERRKNLENQLTRSQYGIGYIDVSEKVVQLNRSVENNLWQQAQELLVQVYNDFGFSEKIFNGTAEEADMINYHNRTLEPILSTIVEETTRKWISKTAQTQGQRFMFFKDPFKLLPVSQTADIVDKFTRNEIMSSNEIRVKIGMKPSKDPKADELINANLNQTKYGTTPMMSEEGGELQQNSEESVVNDLLNTLEQAVDDILGGYENE